MGERLGRPLRYRQLSEAELVQRFCATGMDESLARVRAFVYLSYHDGLFPVLAAPPDDLVALLKHAPTTYSQFFEREHL